MKRHLYALALTIAATPEPAPGEPLEPPPLPDDQRLLYATAKQMIESEGYRVYECTAYDASGWVLVARGESGLSSPDGTIRLLAGSSRNMLLVLWHEYGHQLRMDEPWTFENEAFAEVFSHVVSAYFGIHNPYSAAYIRRHSYTYEEPLRYLAAEADLITYLATRTICKLLRWQPSDEYSVDDW